MSTEEQPGMDQRDGLEDGHGHKHDHGHGHGHGHDHSHLRHASRKALWLALVILSVFCVVEFVGGVMTHSLALISDAAHLLSDVAAVGLALFAQWFACRPANRKRSFGFRRVEILAAQLNGFTLLLVAVFIWVEAISRFRAPPEIAGWPMVVVATVGLFAQILTTVVLARAQGESLNVRGAYLHAMTDAVQSVGVVGAGVIIITTGWLLADPIISAVIGVLVAYSGGRILFEASHVLIEGTPHDLDLDRVARVIEQHPAVEQVTDLHGWSLTTGYNALSAHVIAQPDPADIGHEVLRAELLGQLQGQFPLQHVTLQIERDCELCRQGGCGGWLAERQDGGS